MRDGDAMVMRCDAMRWIKLEGESIGRQFPLPPGSVTRVSAIVFVDTIPFTLLSFTML